MSKDLNIELRRCPASIPMEVWLAHQEFGNGKKTWKDFLEVRRKYAFDEKFQEFERDAQGQFLLKEKEEVRS